MERTCRETRQGTMTLSVRYPLKTPTFKYLQFPTPTTIRDYKRTILIKRAAYHYSNIEKIRVALDSVDKLHTPQKGLLQMLGGTPAPSETLITP